MPQNRRFLLRRRPTGLPVPEDFELVTEAVPAPPPGGVVVRNHYASLDPAQRGWMDDTPSYLPPIALNDPVRASTIGVVEASDHPDWKPGQWIMSAAAIEDYSAFVPSSLTMPVAPDLVPSVTNYLSALGAVGLTAYFGLLDKGKPQAGDTVVVSGAAGAVGSAVGQIAKLIGCRVIGIAGGAEKGRRLIEDYGFDVAIDYKGKDIAALSAEIRAAAPDGANVVFENVGGPVFEAELLNLAMHARIVLCGLISEYNAEEPVGARNLFNLIVKRADIFGFLVLDYVDRFAEGAQQMGQWLVEGKLRFDEDIQVGIENTHAAFMRLFTGANTGKLILKIA